MMIYGYYQYKLKCLSDLNFFLSFLHFATTVHVTSWSLRMKTIGKTIDQQPNITNKPESTNAAKIQNSTSGFKRRGKKVNLSDMGFL